MTNGSLMKVESIAECSPWSILQYFWPALRNSWSWKPIFGLFYTGFTVLSPFWTHTLDYLGHLSNSVDLQKLADQDLHCHVVYVM